MEENTGRDNGDRDQAQQVEREGMSLYERLVDCVEADCSELPELVMKLRDCDTTGQFLASSARYLHAIDHEQFEPWIVALIEGAIDRDRERRYIGSLLEAIWGPDYESRIEELNASDNNFRRIYKRIIPSAGL